MENENLFSETEEALFNKIKRICDNMSNEIKGNDSMDNLSFNSFSGTFSLSTDVLSNLSDISSIPTYQFSNPYAKKKEFHTPQIEKKKRRSKIPIYSPPTKKRFISNLKNAQKNFECDCSPKTPSESSTNRSLHRKQKSIKSNKKIESHHPIQMNTYNYIEPSAPKNFLMPDLSTYSRVCICLFEGRNFPPSNFHNGERSTYAEFQLHPDVLPIQSPISHHHTKHCIYNGGYDISCQGLDFSNVIPIVSIFNYISPHERELLGISYIELHQPKKFNDKTCIFLRNEWVNVYTINNHMKIGEVKLTLVFHTDDKDVSKFIILERRNQLENASNNSDDDFDFVVDSDEFINEVNEEIKKENQNMKKAIPVHPTNEKASNDVLFSSSSSDFVKTKADQMNSSTIDVVPLSLTMRHLDMNLKKDRNVEDSLNEIQFNSERLESNEDLRNINFIDESMLGTMSSYTETPKLENRKFVKYSDFHFLNEP